MVVNGRYQPGVLLNLKMGGPFHVQAPPVPRPHALHWTDTAVPHGGASEPSTLHYMFGGAN